MPHKCAKCGKIYHDSSPELFKGCNCNSRIFIYLREEQVTLKEHIEMLERESKEIIERTDLEAVSEISPLTIEKAEIKEKEQISISKGIEKANTKDKLGEGKAENITIIDKGIYNLDVASIMAGNLLVIKTEHGIFHIRVPAPIKK